MRRPDRVTQTVVVITAVALLVRLVGLGARPFHWDEARVGYWTLRSLAVGVYEYRPVAGGPFLAIVARWLFSVVGTSDAVARLPVALVGGALPLVALLFRETRLGVHSGTVLEGGSIDADDEPDGWLSAQSRARSASGLDGLETISLAVLLGFAPPLLYYARVFRGDLPLAAFALLAVGWFHRARIRGSRRALYAGAAAVGLALTTSGFVVAVLGCWLVALTLVFDEGRVRGDPPGVLLTRVQRVGRNLTAWAAPILRAVLVTVGVALFFYVPRGIIDVSQPGTVLSALNQGSLGAINQFLAVRVLGRHAPPTHLNDHALLPFVRGNLAVLVATALPVVGLALWGFLRERYGGRARPAVSFGAYWAAVGLLAFPIATEVNEPWVAVHVLVPLTLPAAVGLAALWRYTRNAVATESAVRVATALLLLSAAGLHTGVVVANEVYDAPAPEDDLPGFAQPDGELTPAMAAASSAIEGNDGVDVLYVGERFFLPDESVLARPPVPEAARESFAARLPLAWYTERMSAETASVPAVDALPEQLPPVVVTTPQHAPKLSERVDSYTRFRVDLTLSDRTVVIYVQE